MIKPIYSLIIQNSGRQEQYGRNHVIFFGGRSELYLIFILSLLYKIKDTEKSLKGQVYLKIIKK